MKIASKKKQKNKSKTPHAGEDIISGNYQKLQKESDSESVSHSKAPLIEHFIELRKRLILVLLVFSVAFIFCLFFSGSIFNFLLLPYEKAMESYQNFVALDGIHLIYTQPLEYFFVKLKLAVFGALVLSFPVLAYEVYRFIMPGLYKNEKKVFIPYLIASPVLFLMGAVLVFLFVFPFVLSFALSQQQTAMNAAKVTLLPKVSEYLNLAMTLFIAFGLSFQLPVFLSLLAHADLVSHKTLVKGRKYALVIIFAFAAFMTPPDPFSQFILAAAIYTLYELAILAVRLIEKAHKEKRVKSEV